MILAFSKKCISARCTDVYLNDKLNKLVFPLIYIFFVLGSALDLNFNDISVASLDKDLEDQDNNGFGIASKKSMEYLFFIKVCACFL